jgi:hypothetical protein
MWFSTSRKSFQTGKSFNVHKRALCHNQSFRSKLFPLFYRSIYQFRCCHPICIAKKYIAKKMCNFYHLTTFSSCQYLQSNKLKFSSGTVVIDRVDLLWRMYHLHSNASKLH